MQLIQQIDGTLTLQREGVDDVPDVHIRRAFPWSKSTEYLSIRDSKGKEQVLIDRLEDLPDDQKKLIENWLAANSFIPIITRVYGVNTDFGYQEWHVQSDRGELRFRVQEREDVRFLPDGRFSIKDVDGNIYAMPRLEALDAKSIKAVESLL